MQAGPQCGFPEEVRRVKSPAQAVFMRFFGDSMLLGKKTNEVERRESGQQRGETIAT
jgi:hypothetical protein